VAWATVGGQRDTRSCMMQQRSSYTQHLEHEAFNLLCKDLQNILRNVAAIMWCALDQSEFSALERRISDAAVLHSNSGTKVRKSLVPITAHLETQLAWASEMRGYITEAFFNGNAEQFTTWANSLHPADSIRRELNHALSKSEYERIPQITTNPAVAWMLHEYQDFIRVNIATTDFQGAHSSLHHKKIIAHLILGLYIALAPEHFETSSDVQVGTSQADTGISTLLKLFAGKVPYSDSTTALREELTVTASIPHSSSTLENSVSSEHSASLSEELFSHLTIGWNSELSDSKTAATNNTDIPTEESLGAYQQMLKLLLTVLVDLTSSYLDNASRKLFAFSSELAFPERSGERNKTIDNYFNLNRQLYNEQEQKRQQKLEARTQELADIAKTNARTKAAIEAQEAAKLAAFHASPQIPLLTTNSSDLIIALSVETLRPALTSVKEQCIELMNSYKELDYRGEATDTLGDPNVKKLVDIIYSQENLTSCIRTFGISADKYLRKYGEANESALERHTEQLSALYHENSHIKGEIIKHFLNDSRRCILLGTLCLSAHEVGDYIQALSRTAHDQQPPTQTTAKFQKRIIARLEDTNTRRIIKERFNESNSATVSRTAAPAKLAPPPPCLPTLQGLFPGLDLYWDAERARCLVIPRDEPNAAFEAPGKKFRDQNDASAFLDEKARQALIEFKMRTLGLQVSGTPLRITRNPAREINLIEHSAAEIRIEVDPGRREFWKLDKALALWDQYTDRRDELLKQTKALGMTFSQHQGVWCLNDARGVECARGAGLEVAKSEFPMIQTVIQSAYAERARQTQAQQGKLAAQSRAQERRHRDAFDVIPQEQIPVVILDTSALHGLLAPVSKDDQQSPNQTTYLEVLCAAFKQQNRRLYIPAKVLFEMNGTACWLTSDGVPDQVKIMQHELRNEHSIDKALQSVAHLRFTDNSETPHITNGKGQVAIVYGPEDKEFYTAAKAHYSQTEGREIRLRESFQYRYVGAQLGDRAINEVIDSITVSCPVIVATVDSSHVRGSMPKVTGGGAETQAIGWQQLIRYLCLFEPSSFGKLQASVPASPDQAIEDAINYLSSKGKGQGARMQPDGQRILSAQQLRAILDPD
jgi:hypothetical protein